MSQSEIKSSCPVKGLSGGIWFETLWWEGGGGGGAVFGNKKKQEGVWIPNHLDHRIATNNHCYFCYRFFTWWVLLITPIGGCFELATRTQDIHHENVIGQL